MDNVASLRDAVAKKEDLMIEIGFTIAIFAALVCMFIGLLYGRFTRNRKFDVYANPLLFKIAVSIFASMPSLFFGFFEYRNNAGVLGIEVWVVILLFIFLGGCLVVYIWRTRYKIVGTELFAYGGMFTSKRMEISSICTITKTTSGKAIVYLIMDYRGKKIEIPTTILGVEGLIAELNERRERYGYRNFTA